MTTQSPDSPAPAPQPNPARRSAALEEELAMLEAILPHDLDGKAPTPPVSEGDESK